MRAPRFGGLGSSEKMEEERGRAASGGGGGGGGGGGCANARGDLHTKPSPGKAARERYSRDLAALRRLQMAVRRWVLRMKWKRLESERLEKEAALEAAKIAEAEARAQANAATLVQAHVRGMLARGQYSRDRELVIKLQMAARRWVLRMKWGRLQRARREAEAAAAAAAEASARNRAAVIIQSRLRGGFVRKRRAEYLVALRRLQMAVRRWVLRMKWKRLESERLEKEAALEAAKIAEAEARQRRRGMLARGATLVQAHVRGRCVRRGGSNRAAVIIQSRLASCRVSSRLQMAVRRWVLRMKWLRSGWRRRRRSEDRRGGGSGAGARRRSCRRTCEGC